MSTKCLKLFEKANNNPTGLRFSELQRLCECVGMTLDRINGSHYIYHRDNPTFTLSIQERNGRAKAFQVRQLLDRIEMHNLDIKE